MCLLTMKSKLLFFKNRLFVASFVLHSFFNFAKPAIFESLHSHPPVCTV